MELIFSVDSLKIRILLTECTLIDPELVNQRLNTSAVYDEERGVMFDHRFEGTFKQRSICYETNGVKTRFLISKVTDGFISREYLIMLVNAKLFKSAQYFEGITIDNVSLIYDALMSYKAVEFSYDSFLNGLCSDIDFKADFVVLDPVLLIDEMERLTRADKRKDKGCVPFRREDNTGIMWGDRDKATPAIPFLKIYGKSIELKHNSDSFALAYLPEVYEQNLFRVEYNIRNKKFFRDAVSIFRKDGKIADLSTIPNRLIDILSLSQEQMLQMYRDLLSKHVGSFKRVESMKNKNFDECTPQELVILGFMMTMREEGKSLVHIISSATRLFDLVGGKRTSKSHWKLKIEKLYMEQFEHESIEVRNSEKNVLDFVRISGLID